MRPNAKDFVKGLLPASHNEMLCLLYTEKRTSTEDRIVMAAALNLAPHRELLHLWQQLKNSEEPQLPIKGKDLLAIEAVEAGPALGELLAEVERWWIENKFLPTRKECINQAEKIFTAKNYFEK